MRNTTMRLVVAPDEKRAFTRALVALNSSRIPYVVSGAFATHFYTGLWRYTKDLDIFVMPADAPDTLQVLASEKFHTSIEDEHWLGKAFMGEALVDIIWGAGNWLAPVDQEWIDRSRPAAIFGVPVRMAPPEDLIWFKSYVAGRERFDGADICHTILAAGREMDWNHLLSRYGEDWDLLFSYLCLFRFVYPGDRDIVPDNVLRTLITRLERQMEEGPGEPGMTRGPMIDRFSYHWDIANRGYADPREMCAERQGYSPHGVARERAWAEQKIKGTAGAA
jgi:hypothetical protein